MVRIVCRNPPCDHLGSGAEILFEYDPLTQSKKLVCLTCTTWPWIAETDMEDEHYRRSVKPHPSGGYQLHATALDPNSAEEHYPSNWVCSHGEGEFHATYEDAIDCPQFWELLGQIT